MSDSESFGEEFESEEEEDFYGDESSSDFGETPVNMIDIHNYLFFF